MSSQGDGAPAGVNGPPYPPQHQGLGLTPTPLPDIPVSAVFLVLFIVGATLHMGLFQWNMHKLKRKFVFNAALFGFCITRILATSLRMAWARQPRNVSLGIAAQIFVYAGTPIFFISNLFFAQRIVRAQHPHFGWSKPFSAWLVPLCVLIIITILLLISSVVTQFYLPDQNTQDWTRGIQLYGTTLFGVAAFLPVPIVLASALAKSRSERRDQAVDNFGQGSIQKKVIIVLVSGVLLCLGQWYRAGTSLVTPTPVGQPAPGYLSKACFYIFDFTIDAIVIYFWLFIRIDKLYIVPDGARGPHSYGNGFVFAGEAGNERPSMAATRGINRSNRSSAATTLAALEGTGSSPNSMDQPRTSQDRARNKANRVSWGGRSQVDATPTIDEDGFINPETFEMETPVDVYGADSELGYDSKSGRWTTRPVSLGREPEGHSVLRDS